MPSFKDDIKSAKIFYNSWRTRVTFSPALECNIRISLLGWNHITGSTGHKKRSIKDKHRRLNLLSIAEQIILKSTTIQNITTKNNKKYFALEAVMNVDFNGKSSFRKVRVIILEAKNGDKIFYSVMDKK